jgi:HEPN domain-containing protein
MKKFHMNCLISAGGAQQKLSLPANGPNPGTWFRMLKWGDSGQRADKINMNRWADWWQQGGHDIRHAKHASEDGDYEWAAFAAQQAAEKALQSIIMFHGGEPWGHSITGLAEALPQNVRPPKEILEAANRLDKHYIPARYPNGFAEGCPGKLYTRGEAEGAIKDARTVIEFSRRHLPR